jgi:hypothetical protein
MIEEMLQLPLPIIDFVSLRNALITEQKFHIALKYPGRKAPSVGNVFLITGS